MKPGDLQKPNESQINRGSYENNKTEQCPGFRWLRATSELAFTHQQLTNARARELVDALQDVGIDLFEVPISELALDSPIALAELVRSTTVDESAGG